MAGKFSLEKMADIDLNDHFFDSLKGDYPGTPFSTGFEQWFLNKSREGRTALVFNDDEGIGAFVCIKRESEIISLREGDLPENDRLKISTLRIAERYRGKRLGEGAIGLLLWKWQALGLEDVYLTVFDKHHTLISQLEKFGFKLVGHNLDDECVYMRSRNDVDYSDPYRAFPFINPAFPRAGYLAINDHFHDTMFPYSELKNTNQSVPILDVSNGISKVYIGSPISTPNFYTGEPIFIYRKYTGKNGSPGYKSCLTTYCVVKSVVIVKQYGHPQMSYDEYRRVVGNKSVYEDMELLNKYDNESDLVLIELVYYGYFGEGNNINWVWLKSNGCFDGYPTSIELSKVQFCKIIKEANLDVNNIIID